MFESKNSEGPEATEGLPFPTRDELALAFDRSVDPVFLRQQDEAHVLLVIEAARHMIEWGREAGAAALAELQRRTVEGHRARLPTSRAAPG